MSKGADDYYDPESRAETRYHLAVEAFLTTDEALEEAWDEARDQMPDHLADHVLDWFATTTRFHTVFDDWFESFGWQPDQ